MRPTVPSYLAAAVAALTVVCGSAASQQTDDGALYLTPMINDGRIDEARAACEVRLANATTVESYAGYLTVDAAHGSNLFFWFFPAASGADTAPVLLWLQGGPGASSLYSVFNEHGPFSVDKDRVLKPRRYAWTSTHSVLYVDNPVGAGYSFTGDDAGYSEDQTAVGRNLYAALGQFFTLFAEYRDNEFYVAGESYAGKYVPAVSHALHLSNPGAPVKINFKGLAIGNGLIDPASQMVYSEFLYQHGLIDGNLRSNIKAPVNRSISRGSV